MKSKVRVICFSITTLLTIALCFFTISVAFAQKEKITVESFDTNDNGMIDPGKEAEVFYKHKNSIVKEMDKNLDGTISPEELDTFKKKVDGDIILDLVDFADIRGSRPGVPVEEIKGRYGMKKAPKSPIPGLLIRRKSEDINILQGAKGFNKTQGALFAYSRDVENDNEIWQARGAVMYPIRKNIKNAFPTREKTVFSAWSFVPGVSFDRLSNAKNEKKDLDSLAIRLGLDYEFAGGFWDAQYIRVAPVYNTDFDFDLEQVLGQVQWEPVKLDWGIGTSREIRSLSLEYRFRPIVHLEYGYVFETGKNENLKEDSEFFRIGPKLRLDLWSTIELLERFAIHVDWQYLEGVSGDPDNSKLLETGLTANIDQAGRFQFELTYRDGQVPLIQQDTDAVNIGLNIKF
jgi:hypothetical protein